MNYKKITATLLASVMAVTSFVPASFAEDTNSTADNTATTTSNSTEKTVGLEKTVEWNKLTYKLKDAFKFEHSKILSFTLKNALTDLSGIKTFLDKDNAAVFACLAFYDDGKNSWTNFQDYATKIKAALEGPTADSVKGVCDNAFGLMDVRESASDIELAAGDTLMTITLAEGNTNTDVIDTLSVVSAEGNTDVTFNITSSASETPEATEPVKEDTTTETTPTKEQPEKKVDTKKTGLSENIIATLLLITVLTFAIQMSRRKETN